MSRRIVQGGGFWLLLLVVLGLFGANTNRWVGTSPMVIAHRGASADAPENTLASYALAAERGAKMAECDVYLTSDGVPVLFHDRELERTSNGTGRVEDHTLAELKALDAGSWKHADYIGEPIPTLVEYLLAVKGKLRPVIEIKTTGRGIEAAVIAALKEADFAPEDAMIFAFRLETVATIAQLEPHLPTTWLVSEPSQEPDELRKLFRRALAARVSALGIGHGELFPAFLERAHESGMPVFVWTVNEAADMRRLAEQGVDAIITDRPGLALEVL